MPFVRFGRPGLLGTIARTAVIAGTARMTANAVNRHMNDDQEPQYAPPAATPPLYSPPAGDDDLVSRLAALARLRDDDALSEEEFQAAKARLLTS